MGVSEQYPNQAGGVPSNTQEREREKELDAVYRLAALFARPVTGEEALFGETAETVRRALRYPESAYVLIESGNRRVEQGGTPAGGTSTGSKSHRPTLDVLDEWGAERVYSGGKQIRLVVRYYGAVPLSAAVQPPTSAELLIEPWEQRLIESCASLLADVLQRRDMDEMIRESTKLLQHQAAELEQKNLALKEILSQIESEKRSIQGQLSGYLELHVKPLLRELCGSASLSESDRALLQRIDAGLSGVFEAGAPLMRELGAVLTPRELEIAELVRAGARTKQIAAQLHLSETTVERHRNTIRKKLSLNGLDVNLALYLRSGGGSG